MRIIKTILAMGLAVLLAVGFAACNKEVPDTQVAATVNGTDIMEADITARIEALRIDPYTGEVLDDVSWAKLLADYDFTPESLREYVIRYDFAFYVLFIQKAEAEGIVADAAEIDSTIATIKSSIVSSGETYENYLESMGMATEDAHRWILEANYIKDAAAEKMVSKNPPAKSEVDAYVSENAAMYAGKRLWLIALLADNSDPERTNDLTRARAEAAYQELQNGADFSAVARKYMEGSQLAEDGGDLGWGYEYYTPQEVRIALATLELNEISEVIEVSEAEDKGDEPDTPEPDISFYIVKYTDDFVLTDEEYYEPVDISRVPQEIYDELAEMFTAQFEQDRLNQFFLDIAESDEIVINPMPEGLSYDVDMSLADTPDEEGEGEGEGSESEVPEPERYDAFMNPAVPDPTYDENGLGISDLVVGEGLEVKKGDLVEVHYIGTLTNTEVFDNSYDRGSPFTVTVGAGGVIQGWELGLVGAKVGGTRILVIPPELAYGSAERGSIPANSTLIFQLEIVSVNGDSTGYSGTGIKPTN
ncbi:MAG: FKBP-type peptidyl-prolyl cis-trans isomerase [Coriobacteriia bacterium]|nr:FKBP-type peptidyl-prolyl cis-trans isomerase [Coriobacteriia bacterium]